MEEKREKDEPLLLRLSNDAVAEFLGRYRKNLEFGEVEKKKAILRSVIECGNLQRITCD